MVGFEREGFGYVMSACERDMLEIRWVLVYCYERIGVHQDSVSLLPSPPFPLSSFILITSHIVHVMTHPPS